MEIAVAVVVTVVCVAVPAMSPMTRRTGDPVEKAKTRGHDRQFREPPNEGDLL